LFTEGLLDVLDFTDTKAKAPLRGFANQNVWESESKRTAPGEQGEAKQTGEEHSPTPNPNCD